MAEEKVTLNLCQGYGCHEHCVLETHVVDGKIVKTTMPTNMPRGYDHALCAKGVLNKNLHDMPGRLLYPMKRVGERGEGKFERISWDQAFDEVGAKLNEIREKYGPRSVLVNTYSCGYPGGFGNALGPQLAERFIGAFDASKFEWTAVDKPDITTCYMDLGALDFYSLDARNFLKSKMIIIWAGNPIGGTRASYTSRILLDAQEQGAKIVDVGVLFDSSAAMADQFIAINPGTDSAMALSMVHVLIEEGLYDEQYLIQKTVAPFLVRSDNGLFLRESDVREGGADTNFMFVDKSGEITPFMPYTFLGDDEHPELLAEVTVSGIPCKTVFSLLKEEVASQTPEAQEEITGVPAEVVRELTHEFVENKPASIFMYYGMRYKNGIAGARAVNLLSIVSGNMGLPGGHIMYSGSSDGHPVNMNLMGVWAPNGPQNFKGIQSTVLENLAALDDPSLQQYKALINPMGNPLLNHPNTDFWANKIFPNLDLIVAFEIRETDTTRYADYVFPEASVLERYDFMCPSSDYIVLNSPAVEPAGESKPPADIWRGLTQRIGDIAELFDYSTEDYLKVKLSKAPEFTQADPPITFERLVKEHAIELRPEHDLFDPHMNPFYPTTTGRIEFYQEELARIGNALPKTEPSLIHGPEKDKYPLVFIDGHNRFFMQGQFTNVPEMVTIASQRFGAFMNPKTAVERGLKDGDMVEVFNDNGVVKAPLNLSEAYPPGVVFFFYAYPSKWYPESDAPQALHHAANTTELPVVEIFAAKFRAKMEGAGMPNPLLFNPGETTTDVLYDVLCDVRKA